MPASRLPEPKSVGGELAAEPQRATQGFVSNLSWLRQRPLLLLIEVAWRWVYGIPALWLLYRTGNTILSSAPWQATGVQDISANLLLTDPAAAATRIAAFAALVEPGVVHAARWLLPLLLLGWAIVSGAGRAVLLRRMDARHHVRPLTLVLLQFTRVLPLAAMLLLWWLGVRSLAASTIEAPIAAGGEPSIMLYVGGVIALTLVLFVLAALTGWVFTLAPVLSVRNGTGAVRSLRDAVHTGGLRSGFIEINLVLGVVKIALLVLAMVFSASPLPFQAVTTDGFLLGWNIAVGVGYCFASDFFHVARVSSYLRLWQARQHGTA